MQPPTGACEGVATPPCLRLAVSFLSASACRKYCFGSGRDLLMVGAYGQARRRATVLISEGDWRFFYLLLFFFLLLASIYLIL